MDTLLAALIARVSQTQNGFTDILRAANEVMDDPSVANKLPLAHALYTSDARQARMLGVFLFGFHSAASPQTLDFLRSTVSRDPDWRVQEILGMAFDRFCADTGYEQVMPTIRAWLSDPHPNVRRAVSEGLRIWTARPYFKDHPEVAIALLAQHRADESEYLRKSIGNALRDISRKWPDLVLAEINTWDASDKRVRLTLNLASKFIAR